MKFLISRSSAATQQAAPCENASKEDFVWKPNDVTTIIEPRWLLEIDSLDELMAFASKNGRIILDAEISDHIILQNKDQAIGLSGEIEIYDDYRE